MLTSHTDKYKAWKLHLSLTTPQVTQVFYRIHVDVSTQNTFLLPSTVSLKIKILYKLLYSSQIFPVFGAQEMLIYMCLTVLDILFCSPNPTDILHHTVRWTGSQQRCTLSSRKDMALYKDYQLIFLDWSFEYWLLFSKFFYNDSTTLLARYKREVIRDLLHKIH